MITNIYYCSKYLRPKIIIATSATKLSSKSSTKVAIHCD